MMAQVHKAESRQSYYVRQVSVKLATGVYQTEPVACFCGSTDANPVTKQDRYGMPHAMHFCTACGIIYANPRITTESYARYYADEYRKIYDREADTADQQFENGQTSGLALLDYLKDHEDFTPRSVLDIGCNTGSWLVPFQQAGARVRGVDYSHERIAYGQAHGVPVTVGGFESLSEPADLIIMNHVLEHATDIETELRQIRNLLTDGGYLYVAMPGLFYTDLHTLFQNAHPWQFTAETLIYAMECCGFEEVRCDHLITSLWKKSDHFREKQDRPTKYLRDIAKVLINRTTRFMPHVRTVNKFTKKSRVAAIAHSSSLGLREITDVIDRHEDRPAILVSGGPSVDTQRETIIDLYKQGHLLFCIERMYPWCRDNGLIPDYVVIQDASDDVTDSLHAVAQTSTFLICSSCPAAVFAALEGMPTYLFHASSDIAHTDLPGPTGTGVLVNAGGSVSLCGISLAMLMGIQRLHVFGFDCHVTDGAYARGIAGVGEQADFIHVKIDGRAFRTTPAYLAFAQQFFELYEIGKRDGLVSNITLYGDSLITAMSVEPLGVPR